MPAPYPIFVLTLDGDEQRRAPLLSRLDAMGLKYELCYGVDGRQGLSDEYEAMIDRAGTEDFAGRPLTDGEFACALSHRSFYQRIVKENLPGAIILEDDALLSDGFANFVRAGDYEKAPMVLLDYAFGRALPFMSRQVASGMLRKSAKQATTTTAYSISNPTAQKLLEATTPVRCVADWPFSLYHLDAWLMEPRLANHNPPETPGNSHLFSDRKAIAKPSKKPQIPGTTGFFAACRARISIRVDRAKGQR